ncbi:hypothetical protein K503DRAFT_770429, partial [Rhizopogon vinicolor AM-OR11-026]
ALAYYYHVCPRGCILPTRTIIQFYEPPRTIYLVKYYVQLWSLSQYAYLPGPGSMQQVSQSQSI